MCELVCTPFTACPCALQLWAIATYVLLLPIYTVTFCSYQEC